MYTTPRTITDVGTGVSTSASELAVRADAAAAVPVL
jgi:hypothetical protein